MCGTLSELRQAAAGLARGFDPALVPPGQLAQALADAGAVEKMMATIAALVAARLATCGPPATAARQAVRDLAQASGTSLSEAQRALEAAKGLEAQPEVAAVARAGGLSARNWRWWWGQRRWTRAPPPNCWPWPRQGH